MMKFGVTVFATLYLASQLVSAVPYPQQTVDQAALAKAREAALPQICAMIGVNVAPESLPHNIFTDFNDERRKGNTSFGIPE